MFAYQLIDEVRHPIRAFLQSSARILCATSGHCREDGAREGSSMLF
jgi:hypothetical protein